MFIVSSPTRPGTLLPPGSSRRRDDFFGTLWIAFPAVLLIGSMTKDNVPPKLAATHARDCLANS